MIIDLSYWLYFLIHFLTLVCLENDLGSHLAIRHFVLICLIARWSGRNTKAIKKQLGSHLDYSLSRKPNAE